MSLRIARVTMGCFRLHVCTAIKARASHSPWGYIDPYGE
jgi:hypothetical protein